MSERVSLCMRMNVDLWFFKWRNLKPSCKYFTTLTYVRSSSVLEPEVRRVLAFHASAFPLRYWEEIQPVLTQTCSRADELSSLEYQRAMMSNGGAPTCIAEDRGPLSAMRLCAQLAAASAVHMEREDTLKFHELLWAALAQTNGITEQHNRDVVPLFISFVHNHYDKVYEGSARLQDLAYFSEETDALLDLEDIDVEAKETKEGEVKTAVTHKANRKKTTKEIERLDQAVRSIKSHDTSIMGSGSFKKDYKGLRNEPEEENSADSEADDDDGTDNGEASMDADGDGDEKDGQIREREGEIVDGENSDHDHSVNEEEEEEDDDDEEEEEEEEDDDDDESSVERQTKTKDLAVKKMVQQKFDASSDTAHIATASAPTANRKESVAQGRLLSATRKVCAQRLKDMLKTLSKFQNPGAVAGSSKLLALYEDLVSRSEASIQGLAFDCLMTFKQKHLTPYQEQLKHIIVEDKHSLRNELLAFSLGSESGIVKAEHRKDLLPLLFRILLTKMTQRKGRSSGLRARRGVVLRFALSSRVEEFALFLHIAAQPWDSCHLGDTVSPNIHQVLLLHAGAYRHTSRNRDLAT